MEGNDKEEFIKNINLSKKNRDDSSKARITRKRDKKANDKYSKKLNEESPDQRKIEELVNN
jgi:hypothetical protein